MSSLSGGCAPCLINVMCSRISPWPRTVYSLMLVRAAGDGTPSGTNAVSEQVVVSLAEARFDTASGVVAVDARVWNRGVVALQGPLYLVVKSWNGRAFRLDNRSGVRDDGMPYVDLLGATESILPDQVVTTHLRFGATTDEAVAFQLLVSSDLTSGFRIDGYFEPPGTFVVTYPAKKNFYYVLRRGSSHGHIVEARDMSLGVDGEGVMRDEALEEARGLYRVTRLERAHPRDEDTDGIDDVFELERPFLNPLDRSDAGSDFDGDGR